MDSKNTISFTILLTSMLLLGHCSKELAAIPNIEQTPIDPATVVWFNKPVSIWEEALPVGNGRLGVIVFGKCTEENEWDEGQFAGVCARGGFEVNFSWKNNALTSVEILSKAGKRCKIKSINKFTVFSEGKQIDVMKHQNNVLEFTTEKGKTYIINNI